MLLLGDKGSYLKRTFDPLEYNLRMGHVPQGESWVLEKEENWGEVATVEGETVRERRVESRGDWREFYANVRDAVAERVPLLVTPQQVLDVMVGLELALESHAKRCSVPWRSIEI